MQYTKEFGSIHEFYDYLRKTPFNETFRWARKSKYFQKYVGHSHPDGVLYNCKAHNNNYSVEEEKKMTVCKIYEFDGMKNVYVGQTPVLAQARVIVDGINKKNSSWTNKAATIKYYDETFGKWMEM